MNYLVDFKFLLIVYFFFGIIRETLATRFLRAIYHRAAWKASLLSITLELIDTFVGATISFMLLEPYIVEKRLSIEAIVAGILYAFGTGIGNHIGLSMKSKRHEK